MKMMILGFEDNHQAKSMDDTQSWVIYTLDVLYITLTIYCLFNMYHLCKSRRMSKNRMLAAFYFFAVLTLTCRSAVFTLDAVFLSLDPSEIDSLFEESNLYQAFKSLPTFTYVIMGSIIFLFIVELIVQNLPRPHPLLA